MFVASWALAGAVVGWFVPELISSMTKSRWPLLANIGLAYVGALTAITLAL